MLHTEYLTLKSGCIYCKNFNFTCPKFLPSKKLLVQRQLWKCWNNVWNLLKVNNKDIKATSVTFADVISMLSISIIFLFTCFTGYSLYIPVNIYYLVWGSKIIRTLNIFKSNFSNTVSLFASPYKESLWTGSCFWLSQNPVYVFVTW